MKPEEPVKILLVDDRQENLIALEVILANKNYELVKAMSGKEALRILLKEQNFALILIDALMPIMDGFETAEMIRQNEKLKYVPIIFLTAELNAPEQIFKGYQVGAVDFMLKPLSAEILKSKVAVFVDLYRKSIMLEEANEFLKGSRERFSKVFDNNPIGMTLSEIKTNKIRKANNFFCSLFGYSKEEIIGHTIDELNLLSPEENDRLVRLILGYLNEDRTVAELQTISVEETEQLLIKLDLITEKRGFEVLYTKKNGQQFFAFVSYGLVEVENEKFTITSYQDITERKNNEAIIKKRTQQLIEAQQLTHIGSWEWDILTNKIEWTDELYTIYGLQPQELESNYENYLKYIHSDDREYVNDILQMAYKDHKPFNFFHRLIRKDGSVRIIHCIGKVIADSDEKIIKLSGTAQDVTEQKVAEEKAFQLTQGKIKAETEKLMAEEAAKSKQQFLANMSHEIRTPMNAIIGFTNVILKTDLTEIQKKYLNAIKTSGDFLLVLINDILDLAKVNSGKMTFEKTPFKLSTSISSILLLFEKKIKENNLELVCDYDGSIPEVLLGDPVRLRQIIINLISNAVKFTIEGKICVGVHLVKEDAENVTIEFSIADTGIGISEDEIDKIFEDFQQATNETTRLFGGTGLGLPIVKKLIEAQDGELIVKSKVGEGSSFNFMLSFLKTDVEIEAETDNGVEIEDGMKNVKVLVVEDVALNQLLMRTILEGFGFEIDIAGNGRVAIEKLHQNKYDVILMDVQMPEMNGYDATEHIRKNINSQIPIIALTADVSSVDVARCKTVGMSDYISKPVDEKLLYKKIVSCIKESHSTKRGNGIKGQEVVHRQTDSFPITIRKRRKCTDLDYLKRMAKGDPEFMVQMIKVYLREVPKRLSKIKLGIDNSDWESMASEAHAIKSSFSIIGISESFADMAERIQKYANKKEKLEIIKRLFLKIETVCSKAFKELELELVTLEKNIK